ncbi:hydrolase 1, exosortase A system-associated [Qipengyuania sp. XHP0211]|uniref:hydrolase 1, exosortase A system-associated n=1 Tax=Qipengyuania sp. XHP0211 TaxID=3038079 RepID=UPI00241C06FF|nr:hydrolase 1, exosortase A system-associated [Qipengyuania sp. XHP0211]MDG5751130.1 hydrolase 1, exosortase A system-associated [Qipengyuania sp. XHP0211]
MSRLPLMVECQGKRCGATLDSAPGTTGLLMVSGGNEVRAGAFTGASRLAGEIAAKGFPVFRFDRRGVGDSEGENRGYRKSRKDIAAALLAFRALAPQVERVVAFGNCDAATALMLASGAECDALALSNPWVIDDETDTTPSPAAIRSRYASKLANPAELKRLLTGKVDLRKLVRGLGRAAQPRPAASSLAEEARDGLAVFLGPVTILLAENDRTALHFAEQWDSADTRIRRCPNAGHAYAGDAAHGWLRAQLLEALRA